MRAERERDGFKGDAEGVDTLAQLGESFHRPALVEFLRRERGANVTDAESGEDAEDVVGRTVLGAELHAAGGCGGGWRLGGEGGECGELDEGTAVHDGEF